MAQRNFSKTNVSSMTDRADLCMTPKTTRPRASFVFTWRLAVLIISSLWFFRAFRCDLCPYEYVSSFFLSICSVYEHVPSSLSIAQVTCYIVVGGGQVVTGIFNYFFVAIKFSRCREMRKGLHMVSSMAVLALSSFKSEVLGFTVSVAFLYAFYRRS